MTIFYFIHGCGIAHKKIKQKQNTYKIIEKEILIMKKKKVVKRHASCTALYIYDYQNIT